MTATTANPPLTRRGIPVDRDLRILALGSFANRFGAGAVLTTSALYFTRQVGFSATEVALAMSVSAVVGIVVQVPAGHLGDTRGPRRVLTVFMVGAALFSAPPVLATTPWVLALLLGVLAFFERGAGAVNQGVIAQLATGGRGVLFKAYLRAVTNTALGLGSVFGGAALVIDERWAYVTVFVLNAVFTGFAAWNSTRLPDLAAARARRGRAAARRRPRLALRRHHRHHRALLPPLLRHGARPGALHLRPHGRAHRHGGDPAHHQHGRRRALPGAALAPGRLRRGGRPGARARGVVDRRPASPSWRWPTAAARWFAVAALVVGSLVHVVGEMIGSGGQWGLQMGLAPHERQGQYQGFAGLGFSVLAVVAPPVVTYFCVEPRRDRLARPGGLHGRHRPRVGAGRALGARLARPLRRDDALRLTRRPSGPRTAAARACQRRRTTDGEHADRLERRAVRPKSSPPPLRCAARRPARSRRVR